MRRRSSTPASRFAGSNTTDVSVVNRRRPKLDTALITGGAGFIGSALVRSLLARGCRVLVIDDLSTGSLGNLADVADHPRLHTTVDTVMNRSLMTTLVEGSDVVFHLAAVVGVRLVMEDPIKTIETNIDCTRLVLELCAQEGKPVLLSSTSEVYGKLDRDLFSEEDDLVLGATSKTRWCYAGTKIMDEFLARAYFLEHGLPAVVVRLFNTIGPGQTGRHGMVVPRFIEQALANEPITVYGDGSQRRSFAWVGDVVEALIELVAHPGAAGQVFNIGHQRDLSILELAELVREVAASSSEIVQLPYESVFDSAFEDMPRRLPDLGKIERLIGYRPSMDLREMLERIVEHTRESSFGADSGLPTIAVS